MSCDAVLLFSDKNSKMANYISPRHSSDSGSDSSVIPASRSPSPVARDPSARDLDGLLPWLNVCIAYNDVAHIPSTPFMPAALT